MLELPKSKNKKKKILRELILASASPRRRELLQNFFSIRVVPPKIDERRKGNESPAQYVKRLAKEKWMAVGASLPFVEWGGLGGVPLLLAADTTVALQNEIFGKPKNAAAALRMLQKLSGKKHSVLTAFAVGFANQKTPKIVRVVRTQIGFRKLSKADLSTYIRTGDWKDKAGSYGIQGKAFSFVESVHGSLTSVVGLPLEVVLRATEQIRSQA